MAEAIAAQNPPRRRWYRLHLSTWLILLLGLAVGVLLVLPGGVGHYPERPSWVSVSRSAMGGSWGGHTAIVHGWPLPYLWRTPAAWYGFADYAPASTPWKLTDSVRDFRLLTLVADIAVVAAPLAGAVALVEWRRRRRTRAIQFRLRSLLGFLTVAAIVVGWWARERAIGREIAVRQGRLATGGVEFVPRFPLWLRAVVGDAKLSVIGLNTPVEGSEVAWDPKRKDDLRYIIEQLPHDVAVEADADFEGQNGPALASIERLEKVDCSTGSPGNLRRFLAGFRGHPHLREIKILGGVDAAEMALIASIPRLQSMVIESAGYDVTEGAFAELQNCRCLRNLEIDEVTLTANGLNSLAAAGQLRRLKLHSAKFAGCGLGSLCRIHGLEELDVSQSDIGGGDAAQLCDFENLRCLNVGSTAITRVGIKRLLNRSSGPLADNLEQICFDAQLVDDELIEALRKLPRLYLITVSWVNNSAIGGPSNGPNYGPTVVKLRQALPDRDVVELRLFAGSIF